MIKYLLVLSLVFGPASCKVSLVPGYDSDIVQLAGSIAKSTDKLFLQIEDAKGPDRAYEKYKEKYIDVQADLNDLLRKEKLRTKGAELVTITDNIITQFTKYRERHRSEDINIKDAVLVLQREYISDHFNILLAAEKALK